MALIPERRTVKHLLYFMVVVSLLGLGACSSSLPTSSEDLEAEATAVTLHLNPWATNASDTNDGSEAKPLKTIQAAYEKMLPLKEAGTNVRILFYPGVYRDVLINGQENLRPFWGIPNNGATLLLAAKQKGTAIFSGSDVWTGWTNEGNGLWSKAWPYNWGAPGAGDDTTPGAPDVPELAARRELVFVAGARLTQVLNKTTLRDGSFHVDEAANKLTLKLRAGLNPNTATTEVATRENLLYIWNRDNITLRGLVFQHSASKFREGAVAFQEGQGGACRNIRVIDTVIINNGQLGLDNYCDNIILKRNVVNDNGFGGIMGGDANNWLLEDIQTNRNAWRSFAGGYQGWATAGIKVLNVAGFTVRRLESKNNFADGFWMDTNVSNVTLEDSTVTNNAINGLFLEASQGPMLVKNNLICGSGWADIQLSAVAKVTLENNRILGTAALNSELPEVSSVIFLSELRRDDTLFGFGQFPIHDITFRNNIFAATGQRSLTNSWVNYKPSDPADDQKQADYEAFVATLRSSGNTWYSPLAKPFGWVDTAKGYYDEPYTFTTWKTLTKQDADSSFSNPNLTCPQ
jgi:parallel beta-helix repeat protein